MAVKVMKSGILATLQDQGRYGFAKWGINPSGVMDTFASRVANFIVGNHADTTVLECSFPAPQLLFESSCLISICGADFGATIDGQVIDGWRPHWIEKGTTLRFEKRSWGNWAYIAIHGGFEASSWLGSTSTHLKLQQGGYAGRTLQAGDTLGLNIADQAQRIQQRSFNWFVAPQAVYTHHTVGVLKGAEFDQLEASSQRSFNENTFVIATHSDRMGYYLNGTSLHRNIATQLLSRAVNFGTIQLLPSGRMVILMADHQTTGGYPCIAHVAQAYLPYLVQQPPLGTIHFQLKSSEAAETEYFAMSERLQFIKNSCLHKLHM